MKLRQQSGNEQGFYNHLAVRKGKNKQGTGARPL